jgi:hypothetical protein
MHSSERPAADDNAYWIQPPPAPESEDGCIDVETHVLVWKIGPIDTVAGSCEISISILFEWTDPRMVGWSDELPPKLWGPRFYLSNMLGEINEKRIVFQLLDADTGRMRRGISFIVRAQSVAYACACLSHLSSSGTLQYI